MSTAVTSAPSGHISNLEQHACTPSPESPEQSMLARLAEAVLQIPPFVHAYCSSATGLGVHGLLSSVSRSGIQMLLPISLPVGDVVQVTIAHCRAFFGEVLYCVKRSGTFLINIVFSSRHKPE